MHALPPLLSLLLSLLPPSYSASLNSTATSGTFNRTHSFNWTLNWTASFASQSIDLQFRTSHPNGTLLLWDVGNEIRVESNGSLAVVIGNASVGDSPTVTDGRWHRLRLELLDSGELLVELDGASVANATFEFANQTKEFSAGVGFRGCLDNLTTTATTAGQLLLLGNANAAVDGCQADPCTCQHNSACVQTQWNAYSGCNCTHGYTGDACQIEVDTCDLLDGAVCFNGGVCSNRPGLGNYECNCSGTGFVGDNCTTPETAEGATTHTAAANTLAVVIPVVLTVAVATLAAAAFAIRYVRRQRKEVGVYKPSERELHSKYAVGLDSVLRYPNVERLI